MTEQPQKTHAEEVEILKLKADIANSKKKNWSQITGKLGLALVFIFGIHSCAEVFTNDKDKTTELRIEQMKIDAAKGQPAP